MANMALQQLQIPHPCSQSWSGMSGDTERRFCTSCQKHVHNLVELPREEAAVLIQQPHTCVRVLRTADGGVLTADDFPLPRLRRVLNRGGLRVLSRMILLVAPVFFASCRRFVQTTAGEPVPPPSCTRVLMGDVALPAPPATAPSTMPAPVPEFKMGEAVTPEVPATVPAVELGQASVPATEPVEMLGKVVPKQVPTVESHEGS